MNKARGGQRKHWAELARVWAWYYEVQQRCGWTDYRLNYEFAWREGKRPDDASNHRPRIFEWLRKKARKPAGLDDRWRNMQELVEAIELSPGFSGTQALYEAQLWDLMQKDSFRPEQVLKQVDCLLSANSLVRLPEKKIFAKEQPAPEPLNEATVYDRCLSLALQRMDKYSRIELVWLLYILTEPAHSWRIRAILESRADAMLDHFFAAHLGQDHLNYYSMAIRTLLSARIDLSGQKYGGYENIESSGKWLIVPVDLVGKISQNDLLWHQNLLSPNV